MAKPTVLCVFSHLPSFEACGPIAIRLAERGKVRLKAIVRRRLLQTEPRIDAVLKASRLDVTAAGVIGSEIGAIPQMRRADAVLAHVDPTANFKTERLRDSVIPLLRIPHIYVQHGMFQYYLNYALEGSYSEYYSQLMLVWDALPDDVDRFAGPNVPSRAAVVGFPKKNLFAIRQVPEETRDALARFERRVLLCHNFGWEPSYSEAQMRRDFSMLEEICASHPEIAFILRPHRGKSSGRHFAIDDRLQERFSNVFVSDRHSGPFAFFTIHDMLAISDLMITHPSTTILDAAYAGVPVALFDYDAAGLQGNAHKIETLARITCASDFDDLLGAGLAQSGNAALLERYGESIDGNLDRAAEAIEAFL